MLKLWKQRKSPGSLVRQRVGSIGPMRGFFSGTWAPRSAAADRTAEAAVPTSRLRSLAGSEVELRSTGGRMRPPLHKRV